MENNVKVQDDTQSLQSCVSVSVTELRINNLIFINNNQEIGTISAIVCDLMCKPYVRLNYRIDIPYDVDKLKPIPLTEEWLLKLGFVEVDYAGGCYQKEDLTIDMADFNCCYKRHWLEIDVKYLHKLQNLYFTLIGSELQIGNLTEH